MTEPSTANLENPAFRFFYPGQNSLEKSFYHMLMQAPMAMVIFRGSNHVIELANEPFLFIAGKTYEELINRPAFEAMPLAATQGFAELLNDIRTTGNPVRLNEHKTLIERNGRIETAYLNLIYQPLTEPDGTVDKIIIMITEVTEQVVSRRKNEKANALLQQTRDQLSLSISAGNIGTWFWDVQNNRLTWSKEQFELFGVDESEFTGKVEDFIRLVVPEDREYFYQRRELSDKKAGDYNHQFRILRKDGQIRWMQARYRTFYSPEGSILSLTGTNIDITAQKQAEENLQQSKQRFMAAVAAVQGILWTNNARGEMEGSQPGWENLTGQTFEEYQGYGWAKAIHPDDAQPTVDAWNAAVRENKPFVFEHRLRRSDGTWGQYSIRAIPVLKADGSISEWVGVHTDITEQRKAEASLRESEELFRNFSNNITNLAWIADSEGWVYWYNQRWYDYTGTSLEEMQGWGWGQVHHPDHLQRILSFVKEAWKKDEYWELTFPLRSAEGEYRWFLTRGVPIKNEAGAIIRWIGTCTDIHEQYLAEEKIKESERRFRTLAETLPQLVWMTDEKGEYEYASQQWLEYSGCDPQESRTWEKIVHPDDMASIMATWQHCLQTGETYRAEARLKNKEGEYRWHFVQGEPLHNEDGHIAKWMGAFTDIHDQKTLAQRLEKLVAERTGELKRSNDDLQQFAHVASHDLKEPVRKVLTFSSRLAAEFGNQLPTDARLYLSKIESAADRMYTMIDGVLTYSTLNSLQHASEEVELSELVQHVQTDLEVLIHEKGAKLACSSLPVITGAPVLIYQLFYNLINNSLKFSRPGVQPHISISAEALSSKEAGDKGLDVERAYLKITLQDNGIGFGPSDAERIFQTFSRLHPKEKYEGTGLGLALCKKIVERHGGWITATGKENEGACFTIVLPLHTQEFS